MVHTVGAILVGAIGRAQDVVAGYGGAEFACLLPETDVAGAMTIARRMQAWVEALRIPYPHAARNGRLAAKFGVAGITCAEATAAENTSRCRQLRISRLLARRAVTASWPAI